MIFKEARNPTVRMEQHKIIVKNGGNLVKIKPQDKELIIQLYTNEEITLSTLKILFMSVDRSLDLQSNKGVYSVFCFQDSNDQLVFCRDKHADDDTCLKETYMAGYCVEKSITSNEATINEMLLNDAHTFEVITRKQKNNCRRISYGEVSAQKSIKVNPRRKPAKGCSSKFEKDYMYLEKISNKEANTVILTPCLEANIIKIACAKTRVIMNKQSKFDVRRMEDNAEMSFETCIQLMQSSKTDDIFSQLFRIRHFCISVPGRTTKTRMTKRRKRIYRRQPQELFPLTLCIFLSIEALLEQESNMNMNHSSSIQGEKDHLVPYVTKHTDDEFSRGETHMAEYGMIKLSPDETAINKEMGLRKTNAHKEIQRKLGYFLEKVLNGRNAKEDCVKPKHEHIFTAKFGKESMYLEKILFPIAKGEMYTFVMYEAHTLSIKTNQNDEINSNIKQIRKYPGTCIEETYAKMVFIEANIIILRRGQHAHCGIMMLVDNTQKLTETCIQLIQTRQTGDICSPTFAIVCLYPSKESDQESKFEIDLRYLSNCTDDSLVFYIIKHTNDAVYNKTKQMQKYDEVTPTAYFEAILSRPIFIKTLLDSINETILKREKAFEKFIKLNQSVKPEDILITTFKLLSSHIHTANIWCKQKSQFLDLLLFRKTNIKYDIHEISLTNYESKYKLEQKPGYFQQTTHLVNNEGSITKELTRRLTNIEEDTFSTAHPLLIYLSMNEPKFAYTFTNKTIDEISTALYKDMNSARSQQVQNTRIKRHNDVHECHIQLDLQRKKYSPRIHNLSLLRPSNVTALTKCFIMILFLAVASCKNITVTWNMTSNMTYFGSTARLECVISDKNNSCDRTIRQWYGGKPYEFLCRNGACRNKEKYLEQEVSLCKYTLNIHNFSESDVNCEYTCSYGVYRNRKMLKLDKDHFVYVPVMTQVNNTVQATDMLNGSVFIPKAFPKPSCRTSFAGKTIHTDTDFKSAGFLYETRIRIKYAPLNNMCKGIFTIRCMIGSSLFTPVYQNVTLCNEDKSQQNQGSNIGLYVAVATGILALVITVIVIAYWCYKRKARRKHGLIYRIPCRYEKSKQEETSKEKRKSKPGMLSI